MKCLPAYNSHQISSIIFLKIPLAYIGLIYIIFTEDKDSAIASMYCQAYRQLSAIPSSQFCVRLACGGDPTYSFNVKFTGEEVHGTSKFEI